MNKNKNVGRSNGRYEPYQSVSVLKEAHTNLLKHNNRQKSEEFLAEVEEFLIRGSLTGEMIDDYESREASQSLLDYWVTVLARARRTAPDATLKEFNPSLSPILDESACPYVGLNAFQEADKHKFYGRQRLIQHLVDEIRERQFLFVVGASGSGKSSLVLGGLLPALKGGIITGSESWQYITRMVPGSNPLKNLADALMIAGNENELVENFKRDRQQLRRIVETGGEMPAVLVIDQFEEIFTLCVDENIRYAFIDNLIALVKSPNQRHIVILTLRNDYETYLTGLPSLLPYYEQGQVRVTALTANDLREAIEEPARNVGLKFEPGIVDALIKDILGEPAGLPLLQFTLLQLWKRRENKRSRITWKNYRELGDARRALSLSAQEFYDKLGPENQIMVRRILLKMARPSDSLEVTSRRVKQSTLQQSIGGNVIEVANLLVKEGLVRLTEGDKPENNQYEVAHEALVRNWQLLIEWIDDERVNLRQRIRLTSASEQWLGHNKDKGGLLGGKLLEEALQYNDLNDLEKEFVEASRTAEAAAELEKAEALARERKLELEKVAALEQKAEALAREQALKQERLADLEQKAEADAQNAKKMRRFAVALGLIAFLAIGAAGLALASLKKARDEEDKANAATIQAENEKRAAEDERNKVKEKSDLLEVKSKELTVALNKEEEAKEEAEAQKIEAQKQTEIATAERKKAEEQTIIAKRQAEELKKALSREQKLKEKLANLERQRFQAISTLREADKQLERNNPEEAIKVYEKVLEAMAEIEAGNKTPQDELRSFKKDTLSHLAKSYFVLSKASETNIGEAEKARYLKIYDDIYKKAEEMFTADITNSSNSPLAIEDRAEFYLYHDEQEQAENDYESALRIEQQTIENSNAKSFTVYNRLIKGLLKSIKKDDLSSVDDEKIEEIYRRNVEFIKENAAKDSVDLYRALNQIANYYQKNFGSADDEKYASLDYYKQALEIVDLGVKNNNNRFSESDLANSLALLADLYLEKSNYDEALPLYERLWGLIVDKRVLEDQTSNVINSLADIYDKKNKPEKAEEFYLKLLDYYKNKTKDANGIFLSLDKLAVFYLKNNNYEQFKLNYDEVLKSLDSKPPDRSRMSLFVALMNKAEDFSKKGTSDEAVKYYNLSLPIHDKLYGAITYRNTFLLGKIYQLQGNQTDAEIQYKKSLEFSKSFLASGSPTSYSTRLRATGAVRYIIGSRNGLAGIYQEQKKYSEAESLYKESLENFNRLLNIATTRTYKIETLKAYANLLQELGRSQEANDKLSEADKLSAQKEPATEN